jgi:hypothetical protein
MNPAKRWTIAHVASDGLRDGLAALPGAYFTVGRETAEDHDDVEAVLDRVIQLFAESTEQATRRADAAEAKLAESRRHGLRIVDTDQQVKGTS